MSHRLDHIVTIWVSGLVLGVVTFGLTAVVNQTRLRKHR
jgi:hypothetical protein